MKSYPTKFKIFRRKIVQMGALQKLQNSIQTLIILWPVYPIHTNSLFWVIFEELTLCHFSLLNTFIRGKDSLVWLIFHLNILVFQTNGKQPFPSQSSHVSAMAYETEPIGWTHFHMKGFAQRLVLTQRLKGNSEKTYWVFFTAIVRFKRPLVWPRSQNRSTRTHL